MPIPAIIAGIVKGASVLYNGYRAYRVAGTAATLVRGGQAAQQMTNATLGTAAAVAGANAANQTISQMSTGNKAADDADKAEAKPIPQADVCSTCQPPHCKDIVDSMEQKNKAMNKEMKQYRPKEDALGGHPYAGPGGMTKYTVPGGHYEEIRQLQRGLKNDLAWYNKSACYKNAPPKDKTTIRAAQQNVNEPVPIPPGINFIPL